MGTFAPQTVYSNNPSPQTGAGLAALAANQEAIMELPGAQAPQAVEITDNALTFTATPVSAYLIVDTEGQAAADELEIINPVISATDNLHDGMLLHLQAADAGRAVTVVNSSAANGIRTVGGGNITLTTNTWCVLQLRSGVWHEVVSTPNQTIDGVRVDGRRTVIHSAVCSTAATSTAKAITLDGFVLNTGAEVTVKFANGNSVSNPTLSINGGNAIPIVYQGAAIADTAIEANTVCRLYYDGTSWNAVGIVPPIATTSVAGIVKPDGQTIRVESDGSISASMLGRNVGEIVYSLIPLVDAGLHLLDGALIYAAGVYSDFVAYMKDLYDSGEHSNLFVTEAQFQQSISDYGVCGHFVWDSAAGTLRLPKVTGFVVGTIVESSIGELVEAGLPNIEGTIGSIIGVTTKSGAFSSSFQEANLPGGSGFPSGTLRFKASDSNSIYGNSTTVQPQAIRGYVYIVLATTVKTQLAVDIDNIATEVNGKADTDLSNCTKPYITETWHSGTNWYRVWSDGWIEQGGQAVNPTPASGSTATATVTFSKNFSTAPMVLSQMVRNAPDGYTTVISDITTTTFVIRYGGLGTSAYWYACGY